MFKSISILDGPLHKDKSFNFTNGVTALVGPNGCGKSLLAEYMAFALFGSVALRGEVSDYKKLSVKASVIIKGKIYNIKRTTSNCSISDETGAEICQGTKPCNARLIALLGYNYSVYKMGNYAEQLDILGLGKMKPKDRKAALDQTLGIGIIDKLIKYANDTALKYSHESEAISPLVIDPGKEPEKPSGYRELNEIAKEYQDLQNRINDYKLFQNEKAPEEPIAPENKPVLTAISIKDFIDKYNRRRFLLEKLEDYKNIQKPAYSKAALEIIINQNKAYKEYMDYLHFIKTFGPESEPELTMEEIHSSVKLLREWDEYDHAIKAYTSGVVSCPDCGKKFNPFKDEPTQPSRARPSYTASYLQEQINLNEAKQVIESRPVVAPVEQPVMDSETAQKYFWEWSRWDEKQLNEQSINKELTELTLFTDENHAYRIAYERDLALYQKDMEQYHEKNLIYQKKVSRFINFDSTKAEENLNLLAVQYHAAKEYEKDLAVYNEKKINYETLKTKLDNLKDQESRYRKAVENLKEMKLKIKGYVLPSLQKVSSLLLSEMSDRLFTEINIDPDFNILVEGRKINLFSGSEQAMINLALRLGLGQVLKQG